MDWQIKGQAGSPLDDTRRPVASLRLDQASLKLASLDADTLEWSAATEDAKGTGTLVPALGQEVEIWNGETRFFRGHITRVRVRPYSVAISAQGPWWWMMKIPLSSPQLDSEGASSVRPSYVFNTQSLQTSIETLIDRMISNGVPIQRGTIDPMFTWPKITLSERSCAQALADLMSMVPDAVAWFDYAAGGLPVLHVSRRENMASHTFRLGQPDSPIDLDLSPRIEMQVASVDIHGVVRNSTTGKPQWVTQSAGTPVPGKNQIVVVSGPEAAHFLPRDRYDQVEVQTAAMPSGTLLSDVEVTDTPSYTTVTGTLATFILAKSVIAHTLNQKYGITLAVSGGGRLSYSSQAHHVGKPEVLSNTSITGHHVETRASRLPDWLSTDNGITIIEATLRYFLVLLSSSEPDYWDEYRLEAEWASQGTKYGGAWGYCAVWQESIPIRLISQQFTSLATVYRAWDYDYAFPPAGLAEALVAAQNWIPWEGSIELVDKAPNPNQYRAAKLHVTDCLPECATMGALVKSTTYNLKNHHTTLDLGSPARIDFATLADRFRGHPKDNIQIL